MLGPGQRTDADGAQGEHPWAPGRGLLNFDWHLSVGSFVTSGQVERRGCAEREELFPQPPGVLIFVILGPSLATSQ